MNSIKPIIGWVVLVGGIAGIIYPAFIENGSGAPPPSFTQALIALFLEPKWELSYFMRILCVFSVIAMTYILTVRRIYRNIPITIVQTKVKVKFNEDFSEGIVTREQVLRANQKGVSAYIGNVSPTAPAGSTPRSLIDITAFCHGNPVQSRPLFSGSDDKGYEIIHRFGGELPYRWFMPLIPSWALKGDLNQMISFLRNHLVARTQKVVYIDDFNNDRPSMAFTAANYPQRNISILVEFEGKKPISFYAIRVKSNAVVDIDPEPVSDNSVRISVDSLDSETLRFGW